MSTQWIAIGGAVLLSNSPTLFAQQRTQPAPCDRSLSAHVTAGQRVRVTMQRASATTPNVRHDGRWSGANADSLWLDVDGTRLALPLAQVQRIVLRRSAARTVGITALLVGAAFGVSEATNTHPEVVEGIGLGALFVGVPVGWVVATLWPTGATLCAAP